MKNIGHNGGPAFPHGGSEFDAPQKGMSLRDWFAGQAMMSLPHICAHDTLINGTTFEQHIARYAYRIADAMVAAQAAEAERDALADRIEELERLLGLADDQRREWEHHCKTAEAKLDEAEARLKKECGFSVVCYWDADDREIGHIDVCEILDAYDFGTVAEVEHVAVIATTFEAQLPPADDSETDDLFEVCEYTSEAAEAKLAAEISRRATLAKLKGETDE